MMPQWWQRRADDDDDEALPPRPLPPPPQIPASSELASYPNDYGVDCRKYRDRTIGALSMPATGFRLFRTGDNDVILEIARENDASVFIRLCGWSHGQAVWCQADFYRTDPSMAAGDSE